MQIRKKTKEKVDEHLYLLEDLKDSLAYNNDQAKEKITETDIER